MRKYKNIARTLWPELCARPKLQTGALDELVQTVFEKVKKEGEEAVKFYTQQFDKIELSSLVVSAEEWETGAAKVPPALKKAILRAKKNVEQFHEAQRPEGFSLETEPGIRCWQKSVPVEKVGIYIPGGTAPLFSTVLMLAVPAQIAGCEQVVLCTPPDKQGKVAPAILFAAKITGVNRIVKAGGIQAIAALTFGTENIPKVDKIFGPGNQYVTAAKQKAQTEGVAIDLPAGPSELMVVADDSAQPAFVASDLLSQAEHGTDSQVVCVSDSLELLEKINDELEKQLPQLPREAIARAALKNARFLFSADKTETINFVNEYAPEHLIIVSREEDFYLQNLKNAGSVFLGNYSPESAGDYISGTNHTLPTGGFARSYGSLGLDDFMKKISFQRISREAFGKLAADIDIMAKTEGLQAHARAATIRLDAERKTGLTQSNQEKE
ncbi:histidinol dehydrogenase [Candidatus Sulfidibacterium hydrothermale]|uniref:histidinol dehydrogenase n=1 Tax=Candidatus Sulfidibacterium hydrothermale TaxID=2875962 RepID=UPI001F0A07A6|nr:histidinol dehydrogenase [Candidatus Sulfidibacterium hydrothermale]UBM61944.1 histidinol dehydrogenase [Candidatus Sulfidibacterium hydrothermale]